MTRNIPRLLALVLVAVLILGTNCSFAAGNRVLIVKDKPRAAASGAIGSQLATPSSVIPPAPATATADQSAKLPKAPMDFLADFLKDKGGIESTIVEQDKIPSDLTQFDAVLVYVNGAFSDDEEAAIINYTKSGGRLIAVHHAISSSKNKNKYWMDFLGVALKDTTLATQPAELGGHYSWREGVTESIVAINPTHYITSNAITWPEKTDYASSTSSIKGQFPSYAGVTEAYMNHILRDDKDRIPLLGFKYFDDRNRTLFMQDTSGWAKKSGAGWIVYLQQGHFAAEFDNSILDQEVLNSIRWNP